MKDGQQHTQKATLPITDSKDRITSNVMAPVDCQGYVVSRSSSHNSQSCKWLLNVGKSCATPWIR